MNSNYGFVRIWIKRLVPKVSGLSKEQFNLFLCLLCRINKSGLIAGTRKDLMEESGVGRDTVRSLIRKLIETDLIRRVRPGLLMMNPGIVSSADESKRIQQLMIYKKLKNEQCDDASDESRPFSFHPGTGEIIEEHDPESYRWFIKIWPDKLSDCFMGLSRAQITCALYFLDNLRFDGTVIGTLRDISKKTRVAASTVESTISILAKRDFLRKAGLRCRMINPEVAAKDIFHQRDTAILAYRSLALQTKNDEDIIAEQELIIARARTRILSVERRMNFMCEKEEIKHVR